MLNYVNKGEPEKYSPTYKYKVFQVIWLSLRVCRETGRKPVWHRFATSLNMFEYVEHKDSAHTYINLAPYEIVSLSICLGLHSAGCDEDIDPGEEGGERPLPQQLHLHVY